MERLAEDYPNTLTERYKITIPEKTGEEVGLEYGFDLLERAARKRGFIVSGGEADTERMARILLDEFRGGKLGRFTLEKPEESV